MTLGDDILRLGAWARRITPREFQVGWMYGLCTAFLNITVTAAAMGIYLLALPEPWVLVIALGFHAGLCGYGIVANLVRPWLRHRDRNLP